MDELSKLQTTVRSVSRENIHIFIYIVKTRSWNCVNKELKGKLKCLKTRHILYPINRLRNLGLRKLNGYVLDADADIFPPSNCFMP